MAEEDVRSQVLWDLGGMRLEREFSDGDVGAVKQAVERWLQSSNAGAALKLQDAGLLAPGIDAGQAAKVMQTDLLKGIRSSKCEVSARRKEESPHSRPAPHRPVWW